MSLSCHEILQFVKVMLAKKCPSFAQIISHEMTWGSMKAWASHRTSFAYNGCSTSSLYPLL